MKQKCNKITISYQYGVVVWTFNALIVTAYFITFLMLYKVDAYMVYCFLLKK